MDLKKYYPSLYEMEVAVITTYNRLQKLQLWWVCVMPEHVTYYKTGSQASSKLVKLYASEYKTDI
jgi:hypothetical protein